MSIHTLCIAAIVAAMNFLQACGPEIVTVEKTVDRVVYVCGNEARTSVGNPNDCPKDAPVVETVIVTETVTVMVIRCADGSEISEGQTCPPGPVETVTRYVCVDGTEHGTDGACALGCPEGTVEVRDEPGSRVLYCLQTVREYVCMDGSVKDTLEACVEWCPSGTVSVRDEASGKHFCLQTTEVDVNVYVCQNGQRLETDSCPPIAPLVEIVTQVVTRYVCANGTTVYDPAFCAAPTNPRDCPLGQYLDDAGRCQTLPNRLSIRQNGATPRASIILVGTTDMEAARYTLTATGQDYRLRDLMLINCVGFKSGNADCTETGETFGSDEAIMIVKFSVLDSNNMPVQTASAVLWHGLLTWSGLDIMVRQGVPVTVRISVDAFPTNASPIPSGARFQLNVAGFYAVGAMDGVTSLSNTAAANTMTLYVTKPTVSLASGSLSGAATPGLSEVLKWNVTADTGGSLIHNGVTFQVSVTDNNGGEPWFNGDADLWVVYDTNGTVLGYLGNWSYEGFVRKLNIRFNEPIEIPAGTTRTFVLKSDTTLASAANDDSIRVDITDMEWQDAGFTTHIDGSLIKNLPVVGGTLVF